jgi:hypothetical protein
MEILTRYGKLNGCINTEYDADGRVKGCCFEEENKLSLACATLIPQYGEETVRKKFIQTVSFYPSGALSRIALEHQTEVMTPIGEFPAELLTFYEDGAMKRIFPLNGKLSGFWSELDEASLAFPFHFEFNFGEFSAKIISIHFYQSGEIQSIALFPGEVIILQTPVGKISVRTGFSLYKNGTLKSVEPAQPVLASTRIGKVTAFDASAIGVHADNNSLEFSESGEVMKIITSTDKIIVQSEGIPLTSVAPIIKPSPLDEDEFVTIPIAIRFDGETAFLANEKEYAYSLQTSAFTIIQNQSTACSSCSDCSICGKCGNIHH